MLCYARPWADPPVPSACRSKCRTGAQLVACLAIGGPAHRAMAQKKAQQHDFGSLNDALKAAADADPADHRRLERKTTLLQAGVLVGQSPRRLWPLSGGASAGRGPFRAGLDDWSGDWSSTWWARPPSGGAPHQDWVRPPSGGAPYQSRPTVPSSPCGVRPTPSASASGLALATVERRLVGPPRGLIRDSPRRLGGSPARSS